MRRRFPLVAGGGVIGNGQPGLRTVDAGAAGIAAVLLLDLAGGLGPMVEMAVFGPPFLFPKPVGPFTDPRIVRTQCEIGRAHV